MKDINLLATYLKRKYRGRIEILDVPNKTFKFNPYNMVIYYNKNKNLRVLVDDGRVAMDWWTSIIDMNRRPQYRAELHMSDPNFFQNLDNVLLKVGMKPSRLKARF